MKFNSAWIAGMIALVLVGAGCSSGQQGSKTAAVDESKQQEMMQKYQQQYQNKQGGGAGMMPSGMPPGMAPGGTR